MKELISCIAKRLVDNPDKVDVKQIDGEKTTVIELRVDHSDLGKQGKTARAMRTLLNAVSTKMGKKAVLEILE